MCRFRYVLMAPTGLHSFRFRDPVTGKWVRARYLATLGEIAARYHEWEVIGPAEVRGDEPVKMFHPGVASPAMKPTNALPQLTMPVIDATERFLLRLFLRRYVTWCARRRRFAAMQGAARLFAEC
jgi:hypothetical protein